MIKTSRIESILKRACENRFVSCMVLAAICIIAFFPTFSNELMTGWDDQWQVVNSYTSGGWNWKNLSDIFSHSYHGQYSPLNQILYICIYGIEKYNPGYYHATSLALHICNVWLVYILVRHIATSVTGWTTARICWTAIGVALIFGIHPLQVESVAWASASKILLSSLFYLLASYSFALFIEKGRWGYYLLTVFLFLCSYCSKEQAVVFPLWLLLLMNIYGKKLRSQETWTILAPFFVLAIFLGLVFALETRSTSILEEVSPRVYTWWQRLVFACYALVEYACKYFIPYKLQYNYFYPMEPGEALPAWMLMYPSIVATAIACFWKQLRQKSIQVGLLLFLIHISLVLHVLPIGRQSIIADRYMYLSIIGLSLFTVTLISMLKMDARWRTFICFCGCVIMTICISLTFNYTKLWCTTSSIRNQTTTMNIISKT